MFVLQRIALFFTMGGISSAKHRLEKDKKLPKGVFNSLWFGLSPVTERSLSTSIRLEPTGATEIIAEGGGEAAQIRISLLLQSLIRVA